MEQNKCLKYVPVAPGFKASVVVVRKEDISKKDLVKIIPYMPSSSFTEQCKGEAIFLEIRF